MATGRSQEAICRIVKDRILRLETKARSKHLYTGVVVTEDTLLVIDGYKRNIQLYSGRDGKLLTTSQRLNSRPSGVCLISKTELAVCLWNSTIVILSFKSIDDLKLVKTLNVMTGFMQCHSVAKLTSDKLVVSGWKFDDGMLCWDVVSITDGHIYSTHNICIGYDTHLSIKDNTIYISCHTYDSTTNGVHAYHIFNPHKRKFLYQNRELERPWTIMAERNSILVSDSNRIHQLTDSGQLLTVHTVSSKPYGIFYDDQHGVIYTTSYGSNKITVYKMDYLHQPGVPIEILKMDDRSIQLFEEALKDGKETVHSIRIMVVGHMGVGKTTLVKRLLGEEVNISERCSTEGIDIYVNCCDVSLQTHEWTRRAKDSEQHYNLQRLVKVLTQNYQTSNSISDEEQVPRFPKKERSGHSSPVGIGADHDKNTEIQYNRSPRQNIVQNLSSSAILQSEFNSSVDQRSFIQFENNMMPGIELGESSEQHYNLQRPDKVLTQNYQTSDSIADEEQVPRFPKKERSDHCSPVGTGADHDKYTEIVYSHFPQQNIEQNISSRASFQEDFLSTLLQRSSITTENNMMPERELGEKQHYNLQRLVKVLTQNYQTSDNTADQEHVPSSPKKKRSDCNPVDIGAHHDKNKDILDSHSPQQNIEHNLSSTAGVQDEFPTVDQRNSIQSENNTMSGIDPGESNATESRTTDPLREMLKLLKENPEKAKQDVIKYAHLTIWDFAGQYAFYTAHQMFLTRRAIYLLVSDVSGQITNVVEDECFFDTEGKMKCKVHELVEIWMNSIHSCAPPDKENVKSKYSLTSSYTAIPPPVILVGTHVDQILQAEMINSSTTSKPAHSGEQLSLSISQESLQTSTARLQRKRRSTEQVFSSSIQTDVRFADPKLLHKVLRSSTQGVHSSRSTLERNCLTVGLNFHGETPGNGNCFFQAVSSQIRRLNCPIQLSPQQLRQDVVAFLKANRVLQVSEGLINFAEFMYNESFEEYCERMAKDGEWADHVVVVAMARKLQRDIIIITSSPSSGPDDIIAWVVGQTNFKGEPILLGHTWEHHYESLEPIDSSGLKVREPMQDVEKMEIDENDTKNQMNVVGNYGGYSSSGERNSMQHDVQMQHSRELGQKYLTEIRSYLRDKPAIFHLVDKDFAIDNTVEDSELENLKMKIIEVASQQPYWGEEIPTRWFLLEQQLMNLRDAGEKVISRSTMEELNKEGTVQIKESEEMDLFLNYLHETGIIVYFNIEVLRENILLDPKWLIDALKVLINAKPNLPNGQADNDARTFGPTDGTSGRGVTQKWLDFKEKGILTLELVDDIWTKEKYPALHAYRDHMLLLMQQLNIIAKPRAFSEIDEKEENYFLTPCMLRQESPREVISPEQDPQMVSTPLLRCVFTGKFLPTPIFHRLLAACIARWPVAKKKDTSENLIFCGCCVFNLDLFHRLTLYFKNHVVFARITRMVIDEVKTPDEKLCSRVRRFITLNLSKITSYLGQNLQYELHVCPPFHMWLADEGHDPDAPIAPEHMNHARLCVALVTVCGNALKDILLTKFPVQYTDIYQAILANKGMLISRQGRPLLNPDQCKLVFPDPHGQKTGRVDQFDLSLLYTLIRNVSTVTAPITGWGKDPQDQPRDTSLGASVERIRSYRNHIIGHSMDGKISRQDFDDYWNKFDAVLHDIETVLGGQAYTQELVKQKRQLISIYDAC